MSADLSRWRHSTQYGALAPTFFITYNWEQPLIPVPDANGANVWSLIEPLFSRLWSRHFQNRDDGEAICQTAIDRIEKEIPNFEGIVSEREYRSPEHERAATRISFQLLIQDIKPVEVLGRALHRKARKLIESAEARNAAGTLASIREIEPLLKKRLRALM